MQNIHDIQIIVVLLKNTSILFDKQLNASINKNKND